MDANERHAMTPESPDEYPLSHALAAVAVSFILPLGFSLFLVFTT
jgi:hypothetical protein